MLKEEKMKSKFNFKICIIVFVLISTFVSYAEFKVENYFNDLKPQSHVNMIYSAEKKEQLTNITLLYDEIEDIIHLYNPEVLNIWNSWENNKSAKDVYEEYQDSADRLYDAASSQDSEMQEGMMMAQGAAMQIQADKNASDSYIDFLNNYLIEKQLVLTTKISDLNYQKSSYELIGAEETLKEAERKEDTASNALKYGNGTQVELLMAKKSVADANSALVTAKSAQKTYKRNLLLNCAKAADDTIFVAPIDVNINFDISKVDFDSDFSAALSNNIQREIYRRKIENARTIEVKNENEILYKAAQEKIFNDLESKYSNIVDALDSIYNREIALQLANDNLKKAKNEYEHGNISQKELKTMDSNVLIANNNLQISKFDLYIALENYQSVVKGLSDC